MKAVFRLFGEGLVWALVVPKWEEWKKNIQGLQLVFPLTISFVFPHGLSTHKGLRITDYPGLHCRRGFSGLRISFAAS